jgi:hypothetical protein
VRCIYPSILGRLCVPFLWDICDIYAPRCIYSLVGSNRAGTNLRFKKTDDNF